MKKACLTPAGSKHCNGYLQYTVSSARAAIIPGIKSATVQIMQVPWKLPLFRHRVIHTLY